MYQNSSRVSGPVTSRGTTDRAAFGAAFSAESQAIRFPFASTALLALSLIGCTNTSSNSRNAADALVDCTAKFNGTFRLERDQIYPILQNAVVAGTRNPQDPAVPAALKVAADQFSKVDPSVQATRCDASARDYQFAMQGISSGMTRAAALYYDGFQNHNNAEINQATQRIADVNALLKRAVEITSPGSLSTPVAR
jgi:hypothetical protein